MDPRVLPVTRRGEWDNVRECIESTWISSRGRFIDEFETSFAARIGCEHAVPVCNGTVALHLALLALEVGPNDRVAVTTFTYIAAVNAIRYVGAEPVFVDTDPLTLQMDVADFEARTRSGDIRAVIVPHLYGAPADMHEIMRVADERGILVVEDAAESYGTRIGDQHAGTFGHIGTFSFFGNKTVTTGEGGMVCTNDRDLAARVRKLRGQGLAEGREYWHDVIGYNYRMTNICAAIGVAQLQRTEEILLAKRELALFYRDELAHLPVDFHAEEPGTTHSFWMCSIQTASSAEREDLRAHLRRVGIDTRPFFPLVHTMPMYEPWAAPPYPGAESVSGRGLNLPSAPTLSPVDRRRVVDAIGEFYRTGA